MDIMTANELVKYTFLQRSRPKFHCVDGPWLAEKAFQKLMKQCDKKEDIPV
jgi:hypothetical protein